MPTPTKRTRPSTYFILGISAGVAFTRLYPNWPYDPNLITPLSVGMLVVSFVGYAVCFFRDPD